MLVTAIGCNAAWGFVDGVMGPELMGIMRNQAIRFGAELRTAKVSRLDLSSPSPFPLWIGDPGVASTALAFTFGQPIYLGRLRLAGRAPT